MHSWVHVGILKGYNLWLSFDPLPVGVKGGCKRIWANGDVKPADEGTLKWDTFMCIELGRKDIVRVQDYCIVDNICLPAWKPVLEEKWSKYKSPAAPPTLSFRGGARYWKIGCTAKGVEAWKTALYDYWSVEVRSLIRRHGKEPIESTVVLTLIALSIASVLSGYNMLTSILVRCRLGETSSRSSG